MDENKIQFYAKTSSNAYWRYFSCGISSLVVKLCEIWAIFFPILIIDIMPGL